MIKIVLDFIFQNIIQFMTDIFQTKNTRKKDNKNKKIHFYYLFYKNNFYVENYDDKIYKELEKEVKIIFTVFRERFSNIDFGFCYNNKYDTLKELKSEF